MSVFRNFALQTGHDVQQKAKNVIQSFSFFYHLKNCVADRRFVSDDPNYNRTGDRMPNKSFIRQRGLPSGHDVNCVQHWFRRLQSWKGWAVFDRKKKKKLPQSPPTEAFFIYSLNHCQWRPDHKKSGYVCSTSVLKINSAAAGRLTWAKTGESAHKHTRLSVWGLRLGTNKGNNDLSSENGHKYLGYAQMPALTTLQ